MSLEVHQIPPAPRKLRWPPVLWHQWPIALLGVTLALYGGLWTLMLYFASGGKPQDDIRLSQNSIQTSGQVDEIEIRKIEFRNQAQDQVFYSFQGPSGYPEKGKCFVPSGSLRPGDTITVEFLPEDPHINRAVGGRIGLLSDYVGLGFWILVLPGILCLLYWFVVVIRLRHLLSSGDVAVAEILDLRLLPFIIPNMLIVHYSFRDRTAQLCTGGHWVRERSLLGKRLGEGSSRLAVIHKRQDPRRSRLVCPAEFLGQLRL
ncbi:MAG: DUF3592 domain-containing protein [Planctomycetota bacterium]|jgi:hypothetical protein